MSSVASPPQHALRTSRLGIVCFAALVFTASSKVIRQTSTVRASVRLEFLSGVHGKPDHEYKSGSALSATDWKASFNSAACRKHREKEQEGRELLFCRRRPIIYSPLLNLAYMKNAKVASTAIKTFFIERLGGRLWPMNEPLPNGTFLFTFVEDPIVQKLATYAEIDAIYQEGDKTRNPERWNAMRTHFQHVDRTINHGRTRIQAWLDDLKHMRFDGNDAAHWAPAHAMAQLAGTCTNKMDFIGHVENMEADWRAIQTLAKVPEHLRSRVIPYVHNDQRDLFPIYAADADTQATPELVSHMCDIFPSDFICLGYPLPASCLRLLT